MSRGGETFAASAQKPGAQGRKSTEQQTRLAKQERAAMQDWQDRRGSSKGAAACEGLAAGSAVTTGK